MHCYGLKLSGGLVEVSITSQFWGSKVQKSFFKENKRFECSVYRIQVQVIVKCLVDLKKPPNNWHFAYDRIFYEFLKIDEFPNFPIFLEIISCTY